MLYKTPKFHNSAKSKAIKSITSQPNTNNLIKFIFKITFWQQYNLNRWEKTRPRDRQR